MTELAQRIYRLLFIAVMAVVAFPGNIPTGIAVPPAAPERAALQPKDRESPAQLQEIIFAAPSFLPAAASFLYSGMYSINHCFPALVALHKEVLPQFSIPKKIFYHFVDINGP